MHITAQDINMLAQFCGTRDLPVLTKQALQQQYGMDQVDVMVLFGGSILAGGDLLAKAMQEGIAKHYVIVGGVGHTTQTLRDQMQIINPDWDTTDQPESALFAQYLQCKYHLQPDWIETQSTNCGNNITLLLELLQQHDVECHSILLSQDASMQRRMAATLRKYRPDWQILNQATYQVEVLAQDGTLGYRDVPKGMWTLDRYISLLLGEIPRLRDDQNGYGPNGLGFIAHEEIPIAVEQAFDRLSAQHQTLVRVANPAYQNKLENQPSM